jgi:hypothetical protein
VITTMTHILPLPHTQTTLTSHTLLTLSLPSQASSLYMILSKW